MDLKHASQIAEQAADRSRLVLLEAFGGRREVFIKHDDSPVTDADRAAERAIREVLTAAFPEHGVIGEELGAERTEAEYCWMIDPIDGTVSFINGLPFSSTLIALCRRGVPQVAVVDLPMLGQRVTARVGQGAWLNGRRLSIQEKFSPEQSIVCHSDRYVFELGGYGALYRELEDGLKFFRAYTDAFGHYLVSTGVAAVVVDSAMEVWDAAAPTLIVQEAGGRVVRFKDPNDPNRLLVVSGNPEGVEWVCRHVERAGGRPLE
ncbi:inositol monophosphatase [Corallococcus sp. RDP092CA]|uniref:inositol monophosphatase n=1 Tax=Corallococcus sp. RDP092CA TaxID=3109369 RepID=UPI0035B39B8F